MNILNSKEGLALYEKLAKQHEAMADEMTTSDFQGWIEAKVIQALSK